MTNTAVTMHRGPTAKHDGGGYVHKSEDDHVVEIQIPTKKQSRTALLRNMMPSSQQKQELSSLERYRKEVEKAKNMTRPGLLTKAAGAMSSMRSLQILGDDEDDDGSLSEGSFAENLKQSKSSSFETQSSSADLSDNNHSSGELKPFVQKDGKMVRADSLSSLKGVEKVNYKNMFKKAVNLVSITSRIAAASAPLGDESPVGDDSRPHASEDANNDKPEELTAMPVKKAPSSKSVSSVSSDDDDSDIESDSEEMTLKDLKKFIFRCPDDMTVGDLKTLILRKESAHCKPFAGVAKPQIGSYNRSQSDSSAASSLVRRRSRSSSRVRRRRGGGGKSPAPSQKSSVNSIEKRSNSAGRRRNSNPLSANSDHVPRRRRSGSADQLGTSSNHSTGSINPESRRRRSMPRRTKESSKDGTRDSSARAIANARRNRQRLVRSSSHSDVLSSKKGYSPPADVQNQLNSSLKNIVDGLTPEEEDEKDGAARLVKSWSDFEIAPLR